MATNPSIWILTNGRRGDIVQCRAVAEQLSDTIEEKVVNPRSFYSWAMPFGPPDPAEEQLIAPAYPDLIIAAGRRTVPYVRAVNKATTGKCRTVFMKYPGCDISSLGLCWCPAHDKRKGPAFINSLTSPHLATPEKLAQCRQSADPRIASLPEPRLGIILGGNTRHVNYNKNVVATFSALIEGNLPFNSIIATASRRTPTALIDAVRDIRLDMPKYIWDGKNPNPYHDILASSDALLVTGDSHNLISEALAAGVSVHVFDPPGNPAKFKWTINQLRKRGLIQPENAPPTPGKTEVFDETTKIVTAIRTAFNL